MNLWHVLSQCIPGVRDYLEWCNTGCPPAIGNSHKGCRTAVAKHRNKFGLWCSWVLPLLIAVQPRRIWKGRMKDVTLLWQGGTVGPFEITLHSLFSQNFIILAHNQVKTILGQAPASSCSPLSYLRPEQVPAFPDAGGLPLKASPCDFSCVICIQRCCLWLPLPGCSQCSSGKGSAADTAGGDVKVGVKAITSGRQEWNFNWHSVRCCGNAVPLQ